jgi:hypothetical protein
MQRWRAFFAVCMLALWLPATSHVLLEQSGFIHHPQADAANADDDYDHDAADGICSVSLQVAAVQHVGPSHAVFYVLAVMSVQPLVTSAAAERVSCRSGLAPPILQSSWQFLLRTAQLGRAPSSAV